MKRKILIGLAILFVLIQFIRIDKSPMDVPSGIHLEDEVSIPEDVRHLLSTACYDCHSAVTQYPWYSNVAPISFWLKKHVNSGTKHLNFSVWGSYSDDKKEHKIEETIEMLENHWMPILSYKLMHADARLSDDEYNRLVTFFKSIR